MTILSSLRKQELTAHPWDLEEACWNREFLFLSQGTTCHDSSLLVFTNTLLKEVGLALQGDHLHPKSLRSENDPTQTACCGCNIIPTVNCPRPSDLLTQLSKETWSLWHNPGVKKKQTCYSKWHPYRILLITQFSLLSSLPPSCNISPKVASQRDSWSSRSCYGPERTTNDLPRTRYTASSNPESDGVDFGRSDPVNKNISLQHVRICNFRSRFCKLLAMATQFK